MKDEKLNITVTEKVIESGKPVVIELHNTEHNAPTLNEKVKFAKHVTLNSIAEHISKRTFETPVQKNKAIIIFCVNAKNPSLSFYEDPNDLLATVLTSKLKTNPDFADFGINSTEHFTQGEFQHLIRTHAHCFQNVQDATDLIKKLQNFVVKYEQTVESKDDRQGNTKDLVETAIKASVGEITGALKLKMPFFLGTNSKSFEVEIEIEKGRNNMPAFGFYSLDVELQKREEAEKAILTEKDKFVNQFVCLEVEE